MTLNLCLEWITEIVTREKTKDKWMEFGNLICNWKINISITKLIQKNKFTGGRCHKLLI